MTPPATSIQRDDLVCLSHLRWNFVFQRPQHLMTRFARHRRVFFIEEPIYDATSPQLITTVSDGVTVCVPHLPADMQGRQAASNTQRQLVSRLVKLYGITSPVVWLYTPMALYLLDDLRPCAGVIYDCMDELSGFAGAPAGLRERERKLLGAADAVFTGGQSLYEAKSRLHGNVHAFPSSVDVAHFARARALRDGAAPSVAADQHDIPGPRLGYCGVIDERMDLGLIDGIAEARPDWHLVMLGPTAKIAPGDLPRRPNIHYLGMKRYDDLPAYMSGWDAALLPFAHNDATRFISPTKTPEYLAAGCPVVSTSVRDVVRPYGEMNLAGIADGVPEFVRAIERALSPEGAACVARADALLATMSWDRTFDRMDQIVSRVVNLKREAEGTGSLTGASSWSRVPDATQPVRA